MSANQLIHKESKQLRPFDPERDFLNQRAYAENLKSVILGSPKPEVCSINASWGVGKTFFINELKLLFEEKEDAICIKYNAWESDYFDDPFLPLLSELTENLGEIDESRLMIENLPEDFIQIKKGVTNLLDLIKDWGSSLHNITLGANVPISDPSTGIPIGTVGGNIGLQKPEDIFNRYNKFKQALKNFKVLLTLIQQRIDKPIIIFIDELDRCRPDYAIKTLEVVKHFFIGNDEENSEANIKFIIAIDRDQIVNTVKTMYGCHGERGNVDSYLRKFFDIDFYLPKPSLNKYAKVLASNLIDRLGDEFPNTKIFNVGEPCKYIEALCEPFNSSLRDLERLFYKLDKILKLKSQQVHSPIFFEFLITLLIINVHDPNHYKLLCSQTSSRDFLNNLRAYEPFARNYSSIPYKNQLHSLVNVLEHYWNKSYYDLCNGHTFKTQNQEEISIHDFLKNINPADYVKYIQNIRDYTNDIEFVEKHIKE